MRTNSGQWQKHGFFLYSYGRMLIRPQFHKERGNHVVKNCILLYGQNLNLHFVDQQLHLDQGHLLSWLDCCFLKLETHLKSCLISEILYTKWG